MRSLFCVFTHSNLCADWWSWNGEPDFWYRFAADNRFLSLARVKLKTRVTKSFGRENELISDWCRKINASDSKNISRLWVWCRSGALGAWRLFFLRNINKIIGIYLNACFRLFLNIFGCVVENLNSAKRSNFIRNLNGGRLIILFTLNTRGLTVVGARFGLRSIFFVQRNRDEFDVNLKHQEDEWNSEEMKYRCEEADETSTHCEKDENRVEHEIRNEAAGLRLRKENVWL